MSDPLVPIPLKPTRPRPDPKNLPTTPTDVVLYSGGATALVATQLWSKSLPHLAIGVSENVLGPQVSAGTGVYRYPNPGWGMVVLPTPFGYVPPTRWGLQPNWLYDVNKIWMYELGQSGALLPPSEILKTLPDSDPRVQAELYGLRADEQQKELDKIFRGASVDTLLDYYALTKGRDRNKLFWKPEEVEAELVSLVTARAPSVNAAQQLLADARQTDRFGYNLPRPGHEPTKLLFDPDPLVHAYSPTARVITNEDLLPTPTALESIKEVLSTEPADARQQGAFRKAGELVKQLVTERNDP